MNTISFEIVPYVGALPVRFGQSEDDVVLLLGDPQLRSTNYFGNPSLHYGPVNFGFKNGNGVVHAGFSPGSIVKVAGLDPFAPSGFDKLVALDADPMEVLGFVVLLNLGITFTGFHDDDDSQKAVTAFVRGQYDELRAEMTPFRPSAT